MKLFDGGYAKFCVVVFACCLCLSCSSFSESRSWSASEKDIAGTVWVAAIKADKAGDWSSVENEVEGLLPLLFLERRFKMAREEKDADYIAEFNLREREFNRGWESRTSLSVELRLWSAGISAEERAMTIPLAAGQVLLQGNESLSSSRTLGRLLRGAVRKAAGALPVAEQTAGVLPAAESSYTENE